jgi:hypothetical protein
MGGILGAGYLALSEFTESKYDILKGNHTTGVLMVAGSPFSFILGRSDIFRAYIGLFDLQFYNRYFIAFGIIYVYCILLNTHIGRM